MMSEASLRRMYDLLLRAYPREFRARYGQEMQRVFLDQCRDAAGRQDGRLPWTFFFRTGVDWLVTALRERAGETWFAGRRPAQRGFVVEWVLVIVMYLFVTTTLVQAYVVPTGSMEGSLRVGDHMLVDRLVHAQAGPVGRHLLPYREVERGDIVAFLYPEDARQTFVKRVIGVAGDRIRMVDKQVIRNGRRLVEPYAQHTDSSRDAYRDDFPSIPHVAWQSLTGAREMLDHHVINGEVVVPPGALFVMGDNRDNSLDSRYWGFVPRASVVGKPLVVYWSYDARTDEWLSWNTDHFLDLARHFFTKTRWERTLFVPRSERALEVDP